MKQVSIFFSLIIFFSQSYALEMLVDVKAKTATSTESESTDCSFMVKKESDGTVSFLLTNDAEGDALIGVSAFLENYPLQEGPDGSSLVYENGVLEIYMEHEGRLPLTSEITKATLKVSADLKTIESATVTEIRKKLGITTRSKKLSCVF